MPSIQSHGKQAIACICCRDFIRQTFFVWRYQRNALMLCLSSASPNRQLMYFSSMLIAHKDCWRSYVLNLAWSSHLGFEISLHHLQTRLVTSIHQPTWFTRNSSFLRYYVKSLAVVIFSGPISLFFQFRRLGCFPIAISYSDG